MREIQINTKQDSTSHLRRWLLLKNKKREQRHVTREENEVNSGALWVGMGITITTVENSVGDLQKMRNSTIT